MSEPGLLASAPAEQQDSLWETAPRWRALTVAASVLTLAAVATPLLLPQTEMPPHVAPLARPPVHSAPTELASAPVTPTVAPTPAPGRIASLARKSVRAPASPQTATAACPLPANTAPRHLGTAIVVGFINQQQSVQVFGQKAAAFGAPVNPAYLGYVRLLIHPERAADGVTRGTLAPPGAHIAVGDRITFDGAYRDPSGACMWVPTLVAADLGPAKTAGGVP